MFRARMVAEYLQRPPGTSANDFATANGLKNGHQIQQWAYEAKRHAAGLPTRRAPVTDARGVRTGPKGRKIYPAEFKASIAEQFRSEDPPLSLRAFSLKIGLSEQIVGKWLRVYGGAKQIQKERPRQGRQLALMDTAEELPPERAPGMVNHVERHVTPQSIERMKNELAKLHEKCTILEEDNALLRGMATVAQRRGYLNLFGSSGTKKGDGQ